VELREALCQITHIRQQMARAETFRGYRAITVAFSGILALAVAMIQSNVVPSPNEQIGAYLTLWVGAAALAVLVTGSEMLWRAFASQSNLAQQSAILAAGQFLPCIVVGALVTLAIYFRAREVSWMLPGLWCVTFSMGVFASYRLLPRQVFWVGAYYLACGIAIICSGAGEGDLSPWMMGGSFGIGQLLAAGILYWTLERNHGNVA